MAVDIAASVVSGTVTLNGAPLTLTDSTSLYLSTPTGDQVPLVVKDGSYSALVVPDTYDVYFDAGSAGIAGLPASTIKLQSGVVIGASLLALDIQIPTPTTVSGTITVNGAPINGSRKYWLTFGDGVNNGVTVTGPPDGGAYSTPVFPGTYDVSFQTQEDAVDFPHNFSARIKRGIVVGTSPLALDVDIPGATLSGVITVNGELRSDTLAHLEGAGFVLRFPDNSGQTRIATRLGDMGSYSAFLVPATYELSYGTDGKANGFPNNHYLSLGCLIVE
ncbi:MAG TPA: hypothetical protein VGC79_22190 [Polyangiaceae bacterium]